MLAMSKQHDERSAAASRALVCFVSLDNVPSFPMRWHEPIQLGQVLKLPIAQTDAVIAGEDPQPPVPFRTYRIIRKAATRLPECAEHGFCWIAKETP